MNALTATVPTISWGAARAFGALVRSGFRRHATYRQATAAGAFTNTVFGFLKVYVLLAVVGAGGSAVGYDREQLVTFVWVAQGLLSIVLMWSWTDLADRIRSGDVVTDLLRPLPPVVSYLAEDLGRAGHAALTRFVIPVVVGALVFGFHVPGRWFTVPLFLLSVLLATVSSFCCRFLINATAYWLADARGPMILWGLASSVLAGLYFPIRFLPEPVVVVLWLATPFPGLMQTPLDVLVERDPAPLQCGLVAVQVVWTAVLLTACHRVQRRAERKLVVQGG